MQRVLIVGAGYLGLALAEQIRKASPKTDICLARRSPVSAVGAKTFSCDVTEPSSLKGLPAVDAIYYAVAADQGSDEAYEKAYATGVKNILAYYETFSEKPSFYFASSTSVYAASEGEEVTEADKNLATQSISRFIVEGEKRLLDSGWNGSILRYGGLYGPGRTRFLTRVRDRQEVLTPHAPQFMNRIHRDDAAAVVLYAMQNPRAGMNIINAVDREPSLRDDVITWVARQLRIDGDDYPRDDEIRQVKSHKRVISTKLQELGFVYAYPSYKEGYAPLLLTLSP